MGQGKMGWNIYIYAFSASEVDVLLATLPLLEALAEAAEVVKLTAQLYGTVQSRTEWDGTG